MIAPVKRIMRRPQRSTRYHGGIVLITYMMAFMPVIRIASRPIHPASVAIVENDCLECVDVKSYLQRLWLYQRMSDRQGKVKRPARDLRA